MPRRTRPFHVPLSLAAIAALVLAVVALARAMRPRPQSGQAEPLPSAIDMEPASSEPAGVAPASPSPTPTVPTPTFPTEMQLPDVLIDPAVLVEKSLRRLSILSDGIPVARYPIELQAGSKGPKRRAGDGRTPEGAYYVCAKADAPGSGRSITISYPGHDDADRGLDEGLISPREHRAIVTELRRMSCPPSRTALGGGVRLQAARADTLAVSDGGIVLTEADLAELFDALPLGTLVEIVP